MPITYALYPNPVSNDNTYRALIKNRRTYTLEDIERNMTGRHSGISPVEIKAVLELFMTEVENVLADGGVVSTPLFYAQCNIKGNFNGPEDAFSVKRHNISVNVRTGTRLKAVAQKVRTRKTNSKKPAPVPTTFTDTSSGLQNRKVTPGGAAIIKGRYLQFDANAPDEGIFFIGEGNHSYQVETLYQNNFSLLLFLVPEGLTAGEYKIEVRSRMKTRTLRSGALRLVVVADKPTD